MFKNVASQKFIVFAFDTTTNVAKTGDAANITAYVSKDYGTVTVLGDTSATEMDATNAKGYYLFDATLAETNAETLLVSAKSATANISVVGAPAVIFTFPTTGILAPATAGRTLVVDASGLADANAVKLGPSGSGTAQTARDVGASVLVSAGTGTGQLDFTSGVVKANLAQILGTALTETAGQIAAAFKKFFNIATPAATMDHGVLVDTITTYTGNTLQTGDSYARIGANGAGLTAVALTAAYDAAKTAAQAGNAMALVVGAIDAAALATGGKDAITANIFARAFSAAYGSYTFDQLQSMMAAALLGKASGLATTTATFRNLADSGNVIVATVDSNGNRTAVTLTP